MSIKTNQTEPEIIEIEDKDALMDEVSRRLSSLNVERSDIERLILWAYTGFAPDEEYARGIYELIAKINPYFDEESLFTFEEFRDQMCGAENFRLFLERNFMNSP